MTDPGDPGGNPPARVQVTNEQRVPADVTRLREHATRALRALGVSNDAELHVLLVEPDRIAEMKEHAFGARERTDVLSFPMDDPADPSPGPVVLGEVVICPEVAHAQARALGLEPDTELDQLLTHGILHVLGWDHADPASERAMAAEERRLLAGGPAR